MEDPVLYTALIIGLISAVIFFLYRSINPEEKTVKYSEIVQTFCQIYKADKESLCLLLQYLSKEEEKHGSREKSGQWNILADLVGNRDEFKMMADKFIKDSRKEDPEEFLDKALSVNYYYRQHGKRGKDCAALFQKQFPLFASVFIKVVPKVMDDVILYYEAVGDSFFNWLLVCYSSKSRWSPSTLERQLASSVLRKQFLLALNLGTMLTETSYMLAVLPVPLEMYKCVKKWADNEIMGQKAAENVTKSIITTNTSIDAASKNGSLTNFGVIAGMDGNLNSGIIVNKSTNYLSNYLYKEIFSFNKSKVLNDAYTFLGVQDDVSDEKIMTEFKKHASLYYSNKGGNDEAFCALQAYAAIIKADREANKK